MPTGTSEPARGAIALAPRRHRGFTLWELLYAVTIAAVLLGLGVPSLRSLVLDARNRSAVSALVTAVRFARSEAQKRGRTIVLCSSIDHRTCAGTPGYTRGWIVFENSDDLAPAQRAPGERLLLAGRPADAVTVVANRSSFDFRPFPRRSTNGTLAFCDPRGESRSRAVVVSYTGRPRVAEGGLGQCEAAQ